MITFSKESHRLYHVKRGKNIVGELTWNNMTEQQFIFYGVSGKSFDADDMFNISTKMDELNDDNEYGKTAKD